MKVLQSALFALGLTSLASCTTTSAASNAKSEGDMSREDFVLACNKRLHDPKEGHVIGLMLNRYAQAKTCDEAYDQIKAILAKTQGS